MRGGVGGRVRGRRPARCESPSAPGVTPTAQSDAPRAPGRRAQGSIGGLFSQTYEYLWFISTLLVPQVYRYSTSTSVLEVLY